MISPAERTYSAFAGHRHLATGSIDHTLRRSREALDAGTAEPVLVFEDQSGAQIDFDWRGTADDVVARVATHPHFTSPTTEPEAAEPAAKRTGGPGRPRLGVVSREVSLLPRHWAWLAEQRGGASAALRRLIDDARRDGVDDESARRAREAAGRFMWVVAGNLSRFEDASRALYADDRDGLLAAMESWPADVRAHVVRLLDARTITSAGERRNG